MRTERRRILPAGLGFFSVMALALALFLAAAPSFGAVNCAAPVTGADTDGDGFTDAQECSSFSLGDGTTVVRNCAASGNVEPCLNPDVKDLFVILTRASGTGIISNIPSDGLGFIPALGVRLHEVTQAQIGSATSRIIAGTQSAQKIVESLDPNGTDFGEMPWGTPNNAAAGTIYTARIVNFVKGKYSAADQSTVYTNYIKYVLAHEAGHGMVLTSAYSRTQAGYHEVPPSKPTDAAPGTIMQTSVVYTGSTPTTTKFYIPTAWSGASMTSLKLK